MIAAHFPEVTVLHGHEDLWWTGATNLGVAWVLRRCSTDDYILTLNNDTAFGPEYVGTLLRIASARKPALVGSVAVDSRDSHTIVDGGMQVRWSTGKWISMNRGRSLYACLSSGTTITEPACLSGRGTLFPVGSFRRLGLFDERRLPHYAADYEFTIRAARSGYRLLTSYEAPVMSDVASTGLSVKLQAVPWRSLHRVFLTRRSPACLIYRWRFAFLSVPSRQLASYVIADTARVVIGVARDNLRAPSRSTSSPTALDPSPSGTGYRA